MGLHKSVFVDIYRYVTFPLFLFTWEPGLAIQWQSSDRQSKPGGKVISKLKA